MPTTTFPPNDNNFTGVLTSGVGNDVITSLCGSGNNFTGIVTTGIGNHVTGGDNDFANVLTTGIGNQVLAKRNDFTHVITTGVDNTTDAQYSNFSNIVTTGFDNYAGAWGNSFSAPRHDGKNNNLHATDNIFSDFFTTGIDDKNSACATTSPTSSPRGCGTSPTSRTTACPPHRRRRGQQPSPANDDHFSNVITSGITNALAPAATASPMHPDGNRQRQGCLRRQLRPRAHQGPRQLP